MSDKQNSYIRDLLLVALITSVLFGAFSMLHMLMPSHLLFTNPPPSTSASGMPPMPVRQSGEAGSRLLVTILMMLVLWMINIFLYARSRNFQANEQTKHVVRYLVSYIVTFALIALYFFILFRFISDLRFSRSLFFPLLAAFTNNTVVLIILDLVVLQRNKSQIELENTQLRMNSIQAQHQHLKHQLQPHFLFNSLNTLKSLIKRHPLEAEEYLQRLSEILRASISRNNQDVVELKEELKLCEDFLAMQQVRFKNSFRYQIDISPELIESAYLPVFSLQLLVENAIKHNGFTTEEPLQISISGNGSSYIKVSNNKKPKALHEPSSGIGLANLIERYKVLSGKDVIITETKENFSVELPILNQ